MLWLYYLLTLVVFLAVAKILFTSERRQEQILAGIFLLPLLWRLFFLA